MGIEASKKNIYFFGETIIDGLPQTSLLTTKYLSPQLSQLAHVDFVIVTSKRALQACKDFYQDLKKIPLYCIGEKTAAFARDEGMQVVYTSTGYAKDLISEILPMIKGKRGLYLRPKSVANRYITDYVKKGMMQELICYETECLGDIDFTIVQPAVLMFAAPSQVRCFMKHFSFHPNDKVIVIGTTTAKALPLEQKYHISSEKSLESLLQLAKTKVS